MNKKLAALCLFCLVAAAAFYWLSTSSEQAAPAALSKNANKTGKTGNTGASATPKEGRGKADLPVPVVAFAALERDMDVSIQALGTVTALNTATVKARVDGLLVKVPLREGQMVKAGELLAEIDPRPFKAALGQVNGQLQRDQALLAAAKLDLARYRTLLDQDSIARQQVEAQEALVEQYQGSVLADRAQVDSAQLQLEFSRITAPIGGRLGLRQVDVGNMIRASDATGLVVITQTQPINVVFSIPAEQLSAVLSAHQAGQNLLVEALDRDGKTRLASGSLQTIDNQIDSATGTLKLKASFANERQTLFPNQFVNARLRIKTLRAVQVPTAAIQRGVNGTFVYVADAQKKTVSVRAVTLGPSMNEQVALEEGLAAGEWVVVDGADKLREGASVEFSTAANNAANNGADNTADTVTAPTKNQAKNQTTSESADKTSSQRQAAEQTRATVTP